MRRRLAAATIAALLGLLAFSVSGWSLLQVPTPPRTVGISVDPSSGSPATPFVVSFRAPDSTGKRKNSERRYELVVTGSTQGALCISSVDQSLAPARAHTRVRVTLKPSELGSKWCLGTFRGKVIEIESPVCLPGRPCPQYELLLGTIGRFKFTVTSPRAGGDTRPPVFAGIKSAFACTPGPQRPGETTPFNLTWAPATDDVTPSSAIVYDIYESPTAGGENFSHATWTTAPGVTTFKTPGLPSHGTFYFVVRARDRAGNEEHNDVELRGSDPCL